MDKMLLCLLGPLVFGTNANSPNQMLFKGTKGTNFKVFVTTLCLRKKK